ncbi:hypothetical protein DOY81_015445, partial [Sarcophaga bullata]
TQIKWLMPQATTVTQAVIKFMAKPSLRAHLRCTTGERRCCMFSWLFCGKRFTPPMNCSD